MEMVSSTRSSVEDRLPSEPALEQRGPNDFYDIRAVVRNYGSDLDLEIRRTRIALPPSPMPSATAA